MAKKLDMAFVEVSRPVEEPVTKFGGQPIWLARFPWPLSRSTGSPMMFVGQIVLDPYVFGIGELRVAYLFISPDDIDGPTWEASGGENAVIIQRSQGIVEIGPLLGPPLCKMIDDGSYRKRMPCEYAVTTIQGNDPPFVPAEILATWDEDRRASYRSKLLGNKIGGTPGFLQYPEFPRGWSNLLIQIDSVRVPFELTFGSSGVGYIFVSPTLDQGMFIWQDF